MKQRHAFYFGCIGQPGHYLYHPDGSSHYRNDPLFDLPWGRYDLDCALIPHLKPSCLSRYSCGCSGGTQGVAALVHKAGWTALAFCDRSVDSRSGSNSNFLMQGIMDFDEALAEAKRIFPAIFARFDFEIVLHAKLD